MKVLVAEDASTIRQVLEAALRQWGYEVVSAADGNQAWAELQKPDAPQLVLLDREMPGVDGLEFCRRLRARPDAALRYIVLLTVHDSPRDVVLGLEAGADDYVPKPFNSDILRARLSVGRRILGLQADLTARERLQGVVEMARSVCHELNQPLQTVSGFAELLLMETPETDPRHATISTIRAEVTRMGELTRRMMRITQYRTCTYMGGASRMVDIERAASGRSE